MAEQAARAQDATQREPADAEDLDPALIDVVGAGSLLKKTAPSQDPRDYQSYQKRARPRRHTAEA